MQPLQPSHPMREARIVAHGFVVFGESSKRLVCLRSSARGLRLCGPRQTAHPSFRMSPFPSPHLAVFLIALGATSFGAQDCTVRETERVVSIQKPGGAALAAKNGDILGLRDVLRTGLKSRALLELSDRAQLRVEQATELQLLGLSIPGDKNGRGEVSLARGVIYIFSREPEAKVNVKTFAGNGALRGTQLIVEVRGNRALFALLEGELDLSNPQGRLTLKAGQFGEMQPGRAPRRTSVIAAKNILQWALYYPAVLDPAALGLAADEEAKVSASLAVYRAGDLLGAFERYPLDYRPRSQAARTY